VGGAAATLASLAQDSNAQSNPRRIKVGVIGCGSVSTQYLPHLSRCPYVELVSTCDIIPERAQRQAAAHRVRNHYPNMERMLAGAAFDFLVNLTDMQEHERLNRQALQAGKHIWSEKPMANSLAAGQELLALANQRRLRIWGAPTVVNSPQFAFMAKTLAEGKLGKIAGAHADYGHTGPDWAAFFYERGGGSLPDLGVYNLTTLTGLLGPARSVVAMTSVVTPSRQIRGKGKIAVTAEDNAMVLLDHGQGVISHVQCGFNYFNPHGHDGRHEERHTITIVGTKGMMGLVGYDWGPRAVDVATHDQPAYQRHAADPRDYVWQQGASLAAQSLATGKKTLFTPEHALHVLEIISAARQSQEEGRRVPLRSTFRWPVV
jgi:predicted dehydrogenase